MSTHNSGARQNEISQQGQSNNLDSFANFFLGSSVNDSTDGTDNQLGSGGFNDDANYSSDDISISAAGDITLTNEGVYLVELDTYHVNSIQSNIVSNSAFLAVDFDLINLESQYSDNSRLENVVRPLQTINVNTMFIPSIKRQITIVKTDGENDSIMRLQKRQLGMGVNAIGIDAFITIRKIAELSN